MKKFEKGTTENIVLAEPVCDFIENAIIKLTVPNYNKRNYKKLSDIAIEAISNIDDIFKNPNFRNIAKSRIEFISNKFLESIIEEERRNSKNKLYQIKK